MPLFTKKPQPEVQVDFQDLPRHIAIIMDGNGRWAKKRGLPRSAGHAAGAETFRTIATYCKVSDGICLFHGKLEAAGG